MPLWVVGNGVGQYDAPLAVGLINLYPVDVERDVEVQPLPRPPVCLRVKARIRSVFLWS